MKITKCLICLLLATAFLSGCGNGGGAPSDAEKETNLEVAKRIFATCDQRVLGRIQAEGERITQVQSAAITNCVDEMSAAYIEGVKAGRR